MVFGFDPRKLVEERKKLEQEKENDVVKKQQLEDQERIDKENNLRRNSNLRDALDSATKAIREFRFLKNHGEDAYYDAKKSVDPNYRDPRDYTDTENKEYYRGEFQKMKGLFEGVTLDFKTLDNSLETHSIPPQCSVSLVNFSFLYPLPIDNIRISSFLSNKFKASI